MRRTIAGPLLVTLAALLLTGAARTRVVRAPAPAAELSLTRSFEITDKSILAPFTLDRVLAQLIARSGVAGLTGPQLLRQLFDTQNPRPGLADPSAPHCDDTLIAGVASFNGFPRRCPTPEGKLAATPFAADEYFPLGIANRFDLTPPDGANCGQYRLIFARKSSVAEERVHLIFEAVLPNPHPEQGLAACRPVAQFWADLSAVDSMSERSRRLQAFFFVGLEGFAPVIDPALYRSGGGVRAFEQSAGAPAIRFYQFRLEKDCTSGMCTLRFVPDVLENMPFARLFNASIDSAQGRAFRDEFVRNVATLAAADVNLFFMNIPREYLIAESNPLDDEPAFIYDVPFSRAKTTPEGIAFRGRIQAELDRIGSRLTPEQIVTRAEHQNCVGCHAFGRLDLGEGVQLVDSFNRFQVISEDELRDGEGGPSSRFGVMPVAEQQFIPNRMAILRDFLATGKAPGHSE